MNSTGKQSPLPRGQALSAGSIKKEKNTLSENYKCNHTCRCKDGNERYPTWADCSKHVIDRHKHPGCKPVCPSFNLLFTDPSKLNLVPKDFMVKRGRPSRAELAEERDEKKSGIKKKEDVDQVLYRLRSRRSMPPISTSPTPHPTTSAGQTAPPELYFYRCSHTCNCLGSDSSISPTDSCTFLGRFGAQRHITSANRHPQCTEACPAFKWTGVAKHGDVEPIMILKENLRAGPLTKKRRDREGEHAPSLSSTAPVKKSRVEQEPQELDHNIQPEPSSMQPVQPESLGAQPEPPRLQPEPSGTQPEAPAVQSEILDAQSEVPNVQSETPISEPEPLRNQPEPSVVQPEPLMPQPESSNTQPEPPHTQPVPSSIHDEPPSTQHGFISTHHQPPIVRAKSSSSQYDLPSTLPEPPRPPRFGLSGTSSRATPQRTLLPPGESISTFPTQPIFSLSSLSISSAPPMNRQPLLPFPIDTSLTGEALLTQHYSVLNNIRKSLVQIPPELQTLSMNFFLLPHVTTETARFIADGDIPASFLSTIANVTDTVNKVHDIVQSILQVDDPAGLLESQDTNLRDLRRSITKLEDHLFDLRLDLQKAAKSKEGLPGGMEKVKDGVLQINNDITETEKKMKELMVMSYQRLCEMRQ